MFQISVVNRSRGVSDAELLRVVRAINRQIAEDFEPYWAFGGRLRVDGPVGAQADPQQLADLRGDGILYLLDAADANGLAGYHKTNHAGVPYGFVFLDLCRELGDDWSVTLSHEALELIADPLCNLLVQGPHPAKPGQRVYHFFEMCDAVQTQSYELDGVRVSNFVLPSYFTEHEEEGARNDFCGLGIESFGAARGGYVGFFDPARGDYDQYAAPKDAVARHRREIKQRHGGGRVARRGEVAPVETVPVKAPRAGQRKRAGLRAAGGGADAADPIRHVIVLMMENRSFDHLLGSLHGVIDGLDGVDPERPGVNLDAQTGDAYEQRADARDVVSGTFAVPHEFVDVQFQVSDRMAHFVDSFRQAHPKAGKGEIAQVMAYFEDGALPALHTLAKHFTVCDRWFSSMPGPTFPNRFFVHSGTCRGEVEMPDPTRPASIGLMLKRNAQDTIYDRLDAAGHSWKIFHDGVPQTLMFEHLRTREYYDAFGSMEQFFAAAKGAERAFPEYAFIEPRYFDGIGGQENDQHAPSGVMPGERLIADVYNALRANEALWKSCLFVITYDEHGGFYDHVEPPPTIAPDDHTQDFAFDRLGMRVPTILVSPWVQAGVDHTVYDHTSILRYLCEKWGLPHLCRRTEPAPGRNVIGNFAHVIGSVPRDDTPARLDVPRPPAKPADTPFDSMRESLVGVGEAVQNLDAAPWDRSVRGRQGVRRAKVARPKGVKARAKAVEQWLAARKPR